MAEQQLATRDESPGPSTTMEWLRNQAGVEMAEIDGKRMISISRELLQRVNALVPQSQIVQVTRDYSPIPRVTELEPGVDTYKEGWDGKAKKELHALTKGGLSKLAELAQIEHVNTDMEATKETLKVTVTTRMRGPDGVWRLDTKSKLVWLERLEKRVRREHYATWEKYRKEKGEAEPTEIDFEKRVDDEMEHLAAKTETKALNRSIRALLNVRATYLKDDIARPWFTVGWLFTPDLSNPQVGRLIELNYRQSAGELYGGTDEPAAGAVVSEQGGDTAAKILGGGDPTEPAFDGDAPEEEEPQDTSVPDFDPETGEVREGGSDSAPSSEEAKQEPDPTAWDIDAEIGSEDDPPEGQVELTGQLEPDNNFAFSSGPFKDQHVGDVLEKPEGRQWFSRQVVPRLRDEEKLAEALAWLSFAMGKEITKDNLSDVE